MTRFELEVAAKKLVKHFDNNTNDTLGYMLWALDQGRMPVEFYFTFIDEAR